MVIDPLVRLAISWGGNGGIGGGGGGTLSFS